MTVPNGAAGINATGWPAIISAAGNSATSAADLKGLDQNAVVDLFKEKFIGTAGSGTSVFTSSTGPLAQVFGGLPDIPGASLPLRIIIGIGAKLFGVDPLSLVSGTTNAEMVAAAIAAIEKVPILGDLVEIFTGVEDGDLTDVGTWVNNQKANLLALLGIDINTPHSSFDPLTALFGGTSAQGNDIISAIVNAWRGLSGSWSLGDMGNAQVDAATSLATATANIDALRARLDQSTNNGVFVLKDFSTYADSTSLPVDWDQVDSGPGTGTFGISGGRAAVTNTGTASRASRAVYDPASGTVVTLTDYQTVIGVWTSSPGSDGFGNRSDYRLRGRCNAANTTDVYADFFDDRIVLGCTVSGTETIFKIVGNGGTGSFRFMTNTAYYFLAGTAGGSRSFEVRQGRIDGPIAISHTEVGTTSQVGPSYRRAGLGANWVASVFGSMLLPGELLYWALADNVNASVVGSTFRAYRTSTATTAASSGDNFFGNTWYTTTDRISPDFTYAPATANQLTVLAEDTYYVVISQLINTLALGNHAFRPALYLNGSTVVRRGGTVVSTSSYQTCMVTTFEVYCHANDTLRPGYWCGTSPLGALTATTDGAETYWAVSRGRPIAAA